MENKRTREVTEEELTRVREEARRAATRAALPLASLHPPLFFPISCPNSHNVPSHLRRRC